MAVLTCDLCSQDVQVPITLGGKTFCCHGCLDMWQLLGEEQLAELKQGPGIDWALVRTPTGSPLRDQQAGSGQQRALNLRLTGLSCVSCGTLVEHVVHRLPGVLESQVNYPAETLEVSFDPYVATPTQICETVSRLGYGVQADGSAGHDAPGVDRSLVRRFAVSLTLSVLLMMASVPIWAGYLLELPHSAKFLLTAVLWLLTSPIVFWAGWPFLRGAWTSLRHRIITMDLLISTASLAAYFYSVIAAVWDEPYVYFDTCGFLITFLLLGRLLESGTRERAHAVTRSLANMTVSEATVLRHQQEEQVHIEDLRKGDLVVVRPGSRIPVDGVVREGTSDVDESFLTGESPCVAKRPDEQVYAGTTNYTGRLVIENTRDADETVLAQTLRFVHKTQAEGHVYHMLTERLLRVFVPGVLLIAVFTFCLWEWILPVGTATAILRAVATLVIACPCALSVAAPVTSQCAVSVLGQEGVLLRSDEAIERSSGVDTVVFDKTGTLTRGLVRLTGCYPENPLLLQWAASVEAGSEHPYSRAILTAAKDQGLRLQATSDFTAHPGEGVSATVEGHHISVRRYNGEPLPPSLRSAMEQQTTLHQGLSVLWVDGFPRAMLFFRDTLRRDASETVQRLQGAGIEVQMTTGDRNEAARHTALETGISTWQSGLTPVEKAEYIRKLQLKGHKVAYVGDGVNDAAALLQSDLGIAMGSGTDIAIQAGHLVLLRAQLSVIPTVLKTCHQAVKVTRQNIAWAISYNLVALIGAIVGFARPAIAAAAMALSSAFVLANALRLLGSQQLRYARPFGVVVGSALLLFVLARYGI